MGTQTYVLIPGKTNKMPKYPPSLYTFFCPIDTLTHIKHIYIRIGTKKNFLFVVSYNFL